MSNVLFILGAGASAEGGCPTMGDFFSASRRLAIDNPKGEVAKVQVSVQRAREHIGRAATKVRVDTANLESVMMALEMAELVEGVGSLSGQEVAETGSHCCG